MSAATTKTHDIILGNSGDTYHSFLHRIDEVIQPDIKKEFSISFRRVLPGSELAQEGYQKKHQITTARVPVTKGKYEEVVISTADMAVEDWQRAAAFSWVMQLLHGLKLGLFILVYLAERYNIKPADFVEYLSLKKVKSRRVTIWKTEVAGFYHKLDLITQGKSPNEVIPDFSSESWGPVEACYLHVSNNKDEFYQELLKVVEEYLKGAGLSVDSDELEEVIKYQKVRVPNYMHPRITAHHFTYNIPEYFGNYLLGRPHGLSRSSKILSVLDVKDYRGDKKAFAQEVLKDGGKNERLLYPVQWANPGCP
jgi:hypothetical protein